MSFSPRSRRAACRIALAAPVLAVLIGCAGAGPGGADRVSGGSPDTLGPRLADAMLRAGAPDAALRVTDDLLRRDPRDAAAALRRGEALLALDRPADAAGAFATATNAAEPTGAEARLGLARARTRGGEAADAEAAWRAALARPPADPAARARLRTGLAVALDLQDRHEAAQALYREALAEAPDDPVARQNLGLSLALSGRASEGLPLLRDASVAMAAGARGRHNLAVGLALAGDEAGARALLGQDLPAEDAAAALAGLRQFAVAQ